VVLRCSAAHQNGSDVVKSAILGADSFEFGTTALMMLRCVMAKNCNIRCPAGLTTAHEEFKGDPRVLAQFFMNLAHEVRELLADLGYSSLRAIRGQTQLLHLIDHANMVGQIQLHKVLAQVSEVKIDKPIYLEKDFALDDALFASAKTALFEQQQSQVIIEGPQLKLNNRNKTVGGQLAIDLERFLNYDMSEAQRQASPVVYSHPSGRHYLREDSIIIRSHGSAGQSYAAFTNDGMRMEHTGTCNDGVGKTACGGTIVIKSPGGGSQQPGQNVLIGNFALFGASGGKTFINGEAGDRFAVRNSGAMAVVEGVGDFACEYMINGAVLNIGGFGKGFCTGMSGGNAYQYDPDNRLSALYDSSSVSLHSLSEAGAITDTHAPFIVAMLEQHWEHTGSEKARHLLDHWDSERQHFKVALPLWLNRTQTAAYLSQSMDRKAMLEELSVDFAQQQIDAIQQAYRSQQPLFTGAAPLDSATAPSLMAGLINSYAAIEKAQQLAKDQLSKAGQALTATAIDQQAQRIMLERPRKWQDQLIKNIREAYSQYDDAQLAALMAQKRLNDYKTTLMHRDVQSIYSIGSTAWIMEQDQVNREALAGVPSVADNLAQLEGAAIIAAMQADAPAV
jgi:glutamate synthase (NADPH/NADH) large chain